MSPLSSWRVTLPMSYQTVPLTLADCSTVVGVRQAFCSGAASAAQTGKAPGLVAKFALSAGLGAKAMFSPPPEAMTGLFSTTEVAPPVAVASSRTGTAIVCADTLPAAITVLAVQVKSLAPAAPVQLQPGPVGTAASTMPAGRRSCTVYAPTVGNWPMLPTLMRYSASLPVAKGPTACFAPTTSGDKPISPKLLATDATPLPSPMLAIADGLVAGGVTVPPVLPALVMPLVDPGGCAGWVTL